MFPLQGNKKSFVFSCTTIMKALQAFIKRNNSNGDTAIVQGLMVAEDDCFVEMACRAYTIVAVELFVKFSSLGKYYSVIKYGMAKQL
jgi:hypothetical protein